ncbi:MAG: amino acid permease [Pirellulaceae bacterium]|nr:amino acid permease [Pirellulaceae bacterium]
MAKSLSTVAQSGSLDEEQDQVEPMDPKAMDRPNSSHPARSLSVLDATSIIVGTIIGAGIFHIPQWVAGEVDSLGMFLGIWVVGGLLAFTGALCFAELTTAYNEDGGDYVYLRESCGHFVSFQYAWITGWIIRPANMAAMAITFALFGREASESLQTWGVFLLAAYGVSLLAVVNLVGIQAGKWSQNLLTVCKVAGLLLICLIGSLPTFSSEHDATMVSSPTASVAGPDGQETSAGEPLDSDKATTAAEKAAESVPTKSAPKNWSVLLSGLLMALVFVMYSFGGWNDIAFVAAEIREPNRNLPRALFLGLAIVTVVYLYINFVLVMNLGLGGLASTANAPAQMLQIKLDGIGWGDWSGPVRGLLGILVGVSCLGAINAMLITSPRIYYAAGQQHPWFRIFANWNVETQVPRAAIVAQWLATIVLLAACSGMTGPLEQWLPENWRVFKSENPFDELVSVSAPFFWGFLTMVVLGQIWLRFKDPHRPRPIKTWCFPVPNLLFAIASAFMVYRSAEYVWAQQYLVSGGIVLVVFVTGLILGLLSRAMKYEI